MDYKLKEDMTEQHKKHLLELKKIYDESLSDYKRQEGIVKERVNSQLKFLQEAISKLKVAHDDLEKTLKMNVNLKEDKINLDKVKADFEAHKKLVEEGYKAKDRKISDDLEALGRHEKESNLKLIEKENRLRQLKVDIDSLSAKNEGVLANIKNESVDLDIKKEDIAKSNADLNLARDKHIEAVNKFNEDKRKFEKEKINFEADKEKIFKIDATLSIRENSFVERERSFAKIKEELEDREISARLRDIELNKMEQRVRDLQTIYEANKK